MKENKDCEKKEWIKPTLKTLKFKETLAGQFTGGPEGVGPYSS